MLDLYIYKNFFETFGKGQLFLLVSLKFCCCLKLGYIRKCRKFLEETALDEYIQFVAHLCASWWLELFGRKNDD